MPIEIRELQIKVNVETGQQGSGGRGSEGRGSGGTGSEGRGSEGRGSEGRGGNGGGDVDAIVEVIANVLKNKKER